MSLTRKTIKDINIPKKPFLLNRKNDLEWIINFFSSYCEQNDVDNDKNQSAEIVDERRETTKSIGCAIRLNLPDTVLFRDGYPYEWMATDENGA